MSLFLYDFIIIWFFIEINNLLFIYLLRFNIYNKKIIFFYFIIQIIASLIIIYSIIINNIFFSNNLFYILIIISLILKLRIPPFHLWLPLISIYMPWNILFILLTLQKIIPFYIISLIKINIILIYFTLFICSILPPIIIINITNFKVLLSYSSINQSRWIILLIFLKNIIWLKYFIFYIIILSSLFLLLYYFKIMYNLSYISINQIKFNLIFIIFIFNLAGIPPYSFFYIKWFRIYISIYNSNLFIILIIIIFRSLLMLYIYINIIINSIFFNKLNSKLIKFNFIYLKNKYSNLILSRLFISIILIII